MTMRALFSLSMVVVVGALLISSAASAQAQPDQPQANQQPPGLPPVIILPGQTPPPPQQQPGQQAQPQPMPQTGTVSLSFSGTATQAPQSTAVAPNIEMLTVTMYMTSMNAAPEGFMNVMSGVCSGPAFIHEGASKMEASGFCNYTDADGDQAFEHFVIPLQSRDTPLQANGIWTGGTGKYDGLQGAFVLSGIILPTANENVIQIVGMKAGRYALNQSQVMSPMPLTPQGQAPSAPGGSPQQQPGGGRQPTAPGGQSPARTTTP
jgi:hypothetical protein